MFRLKLKYLKLKIKAILLKLKYLNLKNQSFFILKLNFTSLNAANIATDMVDAKIAASVRCTT